MATAVEGPVEVVSNPTPTPTLPQHPPPHPMEEEVEAEAEEAAQVSGEEEGPAFERIIGRCRLSIILGSTRRTTRP